MSCFKFNGFERFQPYWWVGVIDGVTIDLYQYPSGAGVGKTHVQVHRDRVPAQLFTNCGLIRAVQLLTGERK